ncbi:MAG: hypothetical protein QOI61_910 [Actinomycetota bacterium]
MIAETVEPDGGTVALILGVLLVFAILCVVLFVFTCRWARSAGRGSTPALVAWLTVSAFELYVGVVAWGDTNRATLLWTLAIVGVQASFYFRARSRP